MCRRSKALSAFSAHAKMYMPAIILTPITFLLSVAVTLTLILCCSGCTAVGEGIANAVTQQMPEKCSVYSYGFQGLGSAFEKGKTLKILNVHGIGTHAPGHSQNLLERISTRLGLNNQAAATKVITLTHPDHPGANLGTLYVYKRYSDDNRIIHYYEYIWSGITEPFKTELDFDTSDSSTGSRAQYNTAMKSFFNSLVPDAVIYLTTEHRTAINMGVVTAACWMAFAGWDNIPDGTNAFCPADNRQPQENVHYAIISSSLGSLIAVDSIKSIVSLTRDSGVSGTGNRDIHMFMLSNQIPLLSLGSGKPDVFGQTDDYCIPEGGNYNERILDSLNIVAFSDPNDILSYAISRSFVDSYIDSRLCPKLSNVIVNVTPVMSLIGIGSFANPLSAHLNYGSNEQVLDIIINGSQDNSSGCAWTHLK